MEPEQQTLIPADDEKTSSAIRRIIDSLPDGEVRIGHLVKLLRRRTYGGILLLLAALGIIPGISFFAGLTIVVPATQLLLGYRAPLLPPFLRRRAIPVDNLRQAVRRALPWLERLEHRVRPRWQLLTTLFAARLIGLMTILLALVMALPLPFSNLLPALALACFALGLLERDGLLVLVGWFIGVAALVVGFAAVAITAAGVRGYFG